MKLYEVRRFSSENEKWAAEYVKEYTKEAYTKKYRYTPEVLKLDDGRTKYTLCIKAKQVATACKYLMTYFGEEIQNLSSIVADILANDTKAAHTEYTVHGDGYTCFVYVGDDAGNIHIALYLDAEASEETETQTNEETKEETKMNSRKTLDRTAAIKTIFYHLACGGYGGLPRATELYKYLSCDGEIGLTREEIKRYMIENALCDEDSFDYSEEEIADAFFNFADEDEDEEETEDETTAKTVVEPCPHCESEIEMEWDVKTQGYKATCPVCGNLLMLCDECQHRGEDGEDLDDCDFDGRDGSCRFNPKGNVGNSHDSSRVYCPVLDGWMMRYDACRGGCDYDSETDTCKLSRNNTRKGGDIT